MAIINKKIGNATYVYEVTYECIENGKEKRKWECLGKLDENGNLIPSKKKTPKLPTENQEEVKALAVLEQSTEIQDKKPKIVEAQIVNDFTTIRADKYVSGTTKPEGIAFNPQKNEGLYSSEGGAVNVSRNEVKRKEINVMVSLDFKELQEEGITIDMEYRLTPFDRAIHNAVASLWEEGHKNGMKNNEYLTPRIIFQLISGNAGDSKDISPTMRKAILRSIDKMRHTEITIDNSAEVKALQCKHVKYIGSLLESRRLEVSENEKIKINGSKVEDCIQIVKSPILYDYAKIKNQVYNIDIKMLNIPKYLDNFKISFRNTPENIELKEYLLQRIMAMKNQKSIMSGTIRYETMYEYLRIKAPTRNALLVKHKRIREKVNLLLEYWKTQKLIRGYKEKKEGKIYAKVTIWP